MTKRVVYINGWDCGPHSKTLTELKNGLGDCVYGLTVDHMEHSLQILKSVCKQIGEMIRAGDDVTVVGNSAGGFWAYYVARVANLKVVLISPSLMQIETNAKYGVDPTFIKAYDHLPISAANVEKKHFVFLSTEDTVVDPQYAASIFDNIHWLEDEGHVLKNLTPIINKVKEFMGDEDI